MKQKNEFGRFWCFQIEISILFVSMIYTKLIQRCRPNVTSSYGFDLHEYLVPE